MKTRIGRSISMLFSVLILTLAGCGEDGARDEAITAEDRLDAAVEAWNETDSFHFTLELSGRSLTLDESGMLSFNRVEGDVVAPDRMQAETLVRTPVGNTQVAYIAVAGEQWLTNPLTRQWEAAPPELGAEVTGLFDPASGIGAHLANLSEPQIVGEEMVEGRATTRVRGTLPAAVLAQFVPELASADALGADLWIDDENDRIQQIVLREPPVADVEPTWTFRFSRFDQPISIESPL